MADQATSLKMLLDWRRGLPRRREGCSRENLQRLPSSRSTAARSPAGRASCRCCSYDFQEKNIGNTHLGGGRVAVGVLHVVVILRSCGTSYTSCSRCPRALQLRVRLVALRVAVEHIHIKDKLGQHYDNIMTNWAKIMTLIFNLGQRVHKLVAAHIHLGT